MPRFTKEEAELLLEVVEPFARTTQDRKIRTRLNIIENKIRQCKDHHVRNATEQQRAGYVVQKP
jgi:hypothetical protein